MKTPPLGSHIATHRGLYRAFERAERRTCQVMQIFTANPDGWGRRLSREEIRQWFEAWDESDVEPASAHMNYVANLASPEPRRWERSVDSLLGECRRCSQLMIPLVVAHPGAYIHGTPEEGAERVSIALDTVIEETVTWDYTPLILLETTAGQGSALGGTFEGLAEIIDRCHPLYQPHIGVCLDTCHVFDAGYDIRTQAGFKRTFEDFDAALGFASLQLVHLNDSEGGLGSHLDRHAHIGEGELGVKPFRLLMRQKRFKDIPMVLETPKLVDGSNDRRNLALLRSLAK